MCSAEELKPCPHMKLCEECHPEAEYAEKRKKCTDENCHYCGIYWAYQDGYSGLDED